MRGADPWLWLAADARPECAAQIDHHFFAWRGDSQPIEPLYVHVDHLNTLLSLALQSITAHLDIAVVSRELPREGKRSIVHPSANTRRTGAVSCFAAGDADAGG